VNQINSYLPHTFQHWLTIVALTAVLFLLLVFSIVLRKYFNVRAEYTRKFVHISVGLALAAASALINDIQPIVFIAILFTIVNYISIKKHFFDAIHDARHSYGTVYYPLVILIGAVLFWHDQKYVFVTLVLILSVGDAVAAIAGQRAKKPLAYKVWHDMKTVQGSMAMAISAFIIFYAVFTFYFPAGSVSLSPWLAALSCAIPVTFAEATSKNGSDNLSVGFSTMLLLWVFTSADSAIQWQFVYANVFGLVFAILAVKHLLTAGGAISAYLLAIAVYGSGGLKLVIPVLAFFVSSSLLSFFKKQRKKQITSNFEKGSRRDALQVFANGGVAGLCALAMLFFPDREILFSMFIVSLAAANADTWATELGILSPAAPRLITNFKKAEKGRSGAISLFGSGAALAGSFFIVFSAIFIAPHKGYLLTENIVLLTLIGFLATLVDSLMGATVQAQYIKADGTITEKTSNNGQQLRLIQGNASINNDVVNFVAILSAVFILVVIRLFIT